jgi:PAS domain S-box-containing protein
MINEKVTELKKLDLHPIPLAAAVEQVPDSIIIASTDGIIQYVNTSFERITGYLRNEVIGMNLSFILGRPHDEQLYKAIWKTIMSGEVWSGHIFNRKKDSTPYDEKITISPIRDDFGSITHFVAVKRDVTHEFRLEKQLRHAQKMEAIGTLAGGIAHDFNNILAAIIGYIELAQLDIKAHISVEEKLGKVLKASLRAKDLIKQILSFSRHTEFEMKPVQIGLISKEVLKLLRATLPATIEIRQNIESETASIMADPTQIHQLLMNLCMNAKHAMEASGGLLEIRVEKIKIDPESKSDYPELMPGHYLKLTVSDTGHGMDRETLERLFDPFFTTKEPAKGTGMGLAVVHGIVKRHKGAIAVESQPGRGSSFSVVLPRTDIKVPRIVAQPNSLPKGDEMILFVDDEESLVDLGKQFLERLGYQAICVTNPIKALEIFSEQPDSFDLVITDMTMPKMTGISLARKIFEIRPNMPIILTTGFSEQISIDHRFSEIGIKAQLMKPTGLKDLAAAIRKVLDQEGAWE